MGQEGAPAGNQGPKGIPFYPTGPAGVQDAHSPDDPAEAAATSERSRAVEAGVEMTARGGERQLFLYQLATLWSTFH